MEFSFNELDVIFLLVILIITIRATYKGFVDEFLSMVAIILGITVAVLFSKHISNIITKYFGESIWSQVIAFLALFVVTYIIIKLLEGGIHRGIERLNLNKLDKVLGFFLGILEGVLVVCVMIFIIQIQPFFDINNMIKKSFIASLILPFLVPAVSLLNDKINQ